MPTVYPEEGEEALVKNGDVNCKTFCLLHKLKFKLISMGCDEKSSLQSTEKKSVVDIDRLHRPDCSFLMVDVNRSKKRSFP